MRAADLPACPKEAEDKILAVIKEKRSKPLLHKDHASRPLKTGMRNRLKKPLPRHGYSLA
nr:hypothetical protein [Rhizobium sp. ACO-34A]